MPFLFGIKKKNEIKIIEVITPTTASRLIKTVNLLNNHDFVTTWRRG